MSDKTIIHDRDPVPLERISVQFVDGLTEADTRSVSVELNDKYELDMSVLAPNAMLLEGFLETIKEILNRVQEREGVAEAKRVVLVDDYSGERLGEVLRSRKAVITYKVRSRKPANLSADGKKFKSRVHRPQRTYEDPSRFDRVMEVKVRYVMHEIELSVWSPNATAANQVALWLERTLIRETWRVKEQGADLFEWAGRRADMTMGIAGQKLETRPLDFKVRLAEVIISSHPKIRTIRLRSGTYLMGLED